MGALNRRFNRKNTEQTGWPEAKAIATAWEAAGQWEGDTSVPVRQSLPGSGESTTTTSDATTIERAVTAFRAEHSEFSAPNTQKKYRIIMKKLKAYSSDKGYVMISQAIVGRLLRGGSRSARKLKRLWDLCGPWPEKPTPHRFRHTFARILLQRPNVTVRDVAELPGDTEEVVRRHYAAWVTERQERLTAALKEAIAARVIDP